MRNLRIAGGFVISGIALYIAFRGVDWREAGGAIRDANVWLLAAALPVLLLLFVVRAYRWRLLLYPTSDVSVFSCFAALNIGYAAGNLLPLQMGELARAYVLGEAAGIPKARVLSTIAVERLLDVIILLTLAVSLVPFVALPAPASASLALVIAVVAAAVTGITIAVLDRPRVERWIERMAGAMPERAGAQIRRFSGSLLDGLSAIGDARMLFAIIAWSLISWTVSAAVVWLLLQAFSLDVPLSAAPFLLVVTTLAFFIPSSPGSVGVYDAVAVRSLVGVFGVAQGAATSYAIVAHAFYLVPATLLGAFFFWRHQATLRGMRAWSDDSTPRIDSARTPALTDPPQDAVVL